MKLLRTVVVAGLAACSLTSCLQQEKVIKLSTDGSGTIEETLVMNKEIIERMKQMAAGFAAFTQGKEATTPFQVLDENKLREAAERMGDGVTFVSAKPLNTATGEGFTATYAFTDINKLKIDQNPGDNLPGASGPMAKLMTKPKKEPVKFEFTKGTPALLTVKMPQPKDGDLPKERPKRPAGGEEMAMTMMAQMLKDMKITLAIEVPGRIVQTNAEYSDSTRVTLLEMDFNKVAANPEAFKALSQANPKSIGEAKALAKGVDGLKAETQPSVTVKFQ